MAPPYFQEISTILIYVGYACLATIPVYVEPDDNTCQIIFTILAILPILFSSRNIWRLAVIIWNRNKNDDHLLYFISLICGYGTWSISWALIHMIFWVWDHDSFEHMHHNISAFQALRYFIGGSFMLSPGGPPPIYMDPSNDWSALLMGVFHSYSNYVFTWGGLAIAALILHERLYESMKSLVESRQQPTQPQPMNYGQYSEITPVSTSSYPAQLQIFTSYP